MPGVQARQLLQQWDGAPECCSDQGGQHLGLGLCRGHGLCVRGHHQGPQHRLVVSCSATGSRFGVYFVMLEDVQELIVLV